MITIIVITLSINNYIIVLTVWLNGKLFFNRIIGQRTRSRLCIKRVFFLKGDGNWNVCLLGWICDICIKPEPIVRKIKLAKYVYT